MKKHIIWVGMAFVALCAMSSCETDEDKAMDQYFDSQSLYTDAIAEAFKNIKSVTVSGQVNGYDYVDLGLSSGTKWATYNVGASKPTEYGDLLSWGETTESASYDKEHYKFFDSNANQYSKYIADGNYVTLDEEDDAATVRWGSEWRMPSIEELQELKMHCYWNWEENFLGSGVNGMVGISSSNGNVIFLPGAGSASYLYGGMHQRGQVAAFWSSTLAGTTGEAYFFGYAKGVAYSIESERYNGRSVRGVVK